MFKNYIKIAFRNLIRARLFSFITLFGLTLGFTCFILIVLYVNDEVSFDKFHKDADRTYRIVQHVQEESGVERKTALIAPMIGPGVKQSLPEIDDFTRIALIGRVTVGNDPLTRGYERICIPDSNFFAFFDFKLLQGNPATALQEANGLVITKTLAEKYFIQKDVLGQDLYSAIYTTTITGVMDDFPANSHLSFDMFVPAKEIGKLIDGWNEYMSTNWTDNDVVTYVKLNADADISALEQKITKLISENYGPEEKFNSTFSLQPLAAIHFNSADIKGVEGGFNENEGKIYYVLLFLSIGILILLIAAFNYMNLSTAAALQRSKEIGLRKTAGASRTQLILQFLSETTILTFIALILSVFIADLLLPYLNNFTDKAMVLQLLDFRIWIGLILLGLLIGVLSGSYPAYLITKVTPSAALKAEIHFGSKGYNLRKALVLAQFTIAIVMIIGTLVINRQNNFLKEKDLGFQVDNLVTIDINSQILRNDFEAIKSEMNTLSAVSSVTVSSRVPGEWKDFPLIEAKLSGNDNMDEMIFIGADADFLQTYDVNLLAGRNLMQASADSSSVLINKAAAEALGLQDVIGHQIVVENINWGGRKEVLESPYRATIVGVVEDFHFESFRQSLRPMVIGHWTNPIQKIDYYTLNVSSTDFASTLAQLQEINNRFDAENPIEYNFLDEKFERFHTDDTRQGSLFLMFSSVVILISCMGLFALASFMIRHRTKEVGIRKVLGAGLRQITLLIIKDFALLVAIAFLIASPVAYWLATQWLSDFAYQAPLSLWSFVLGGALALILAVLTVSYLTLKAASADPVKSLRNQ